MDQEPSDDLALSLMHTLLEFERRRARESAPTPAVPSASPPGDDPAAPPAPTVPAGIGAEVLTIVTEIRAELARLRDEVASVRALLDEPVPDRPPADRTGAPPPPPEPGTRFPDADDAGGVAFELDLEPRGSSAAPDDPDAAGWLLIREVSRETG